MGQLLTWYSAHNSIVIQALSVLVGLLLCFFIFRLFFSSRSVDTDAVSGSKSILGSQELETKINQIIESQSKALSGAKAGSAEGSTDQIEQLQTEIFNLRQTLKEKESQSVGGETAATAAASASAAAPSAQGTEPQAAAEYMKQIEDLKNRLSDYEVIAEDIADLQSLREENQKLQAQLQKTGGSVASSAANEAPATTPAPVAAETKDDAEDAAMSATNQSTVATADLDDLLQNITQDVNVSENAQATDEEKDLIQQFEKSKGS